MILRSTPVWQCIGRCGGSSGRGCHLIRWAGIGTEHLGAR